MFSLLYEELGGLPRRFSELPRHSHAKIVTSLCHITGFLLFCDVQTDAAKTHFYNYSKMAQSVLGNISYN